MAAAVKRIVVKVTAEEKQAIAAKARRLRLSITALMRRGVFAFSPDDADAELRALADAPMTAANRACATIDSSLVLWALSRRATGGSLQWRPKERRLRPEGADRHKFSWRTVSLKLTPLLLDLATSWLSAVVRCPLPRAPLSCWCQDERKAARFAQARPCLA